MTPKTRKPLLFSAIALTASLMACVTPDGPVFGDWYGFNPLPTPQGNIAIELVLMGKQNASSGSYRLHRQSFWAEDMMFNHSDSLDGTWTASNVTINGHTWRNILLTGPELHITHYVLLPSGYLVPADERGAPDMGEGGWVCCRLAPRARGSFGYGRA